jgi:putative transposase
MLRIHEGELFSFPEGAYRFREVEEANRSYMFMRVGSAGRMYKTETQLEDLLDSGKAIRNPDIKKTKEGELKAVRQDGLAPDEEDSQAGLRARTFQFYVRKWDADPSIGKGNPGLALFIALWRPAAHQKGLTWDVRPARLRHAINHCGEPGRRPIQAFLSRRGKVKRKKFDQEVELMLDLAVAFYFSDRLIDYNYAFAHFRGLLKAENERRAALKLDPLKGPRKLETLRRRITRAICRATWATKYSRREADQKFNGVNTGPMATRPLELVIMDHTVLDTWCVLDDVHYVPFKRPTLTVAIDVATRMPLGYLMSGEPASLYSVITTLKRVNKNKKYVAKVYPEIQGKWDGWGHPETILVDRGWEFVSPSFQDMLADLGTEVIWAPIETPEYKAIGERFFKTLNTKLFHHLEGAVPYDPKVMRLAKLDPREKAILTLRDFDRLMHQAIIEVYQNEKHTGLGGIPARVWQEEIEKGDRRFIDDVAALDGVLGCVTERTLTKAGIRFRDMVFHDRDKTSLLLNDLVAYERKRDQSDKRYASARVRVKVKWNPSDCSQVEVWPIRSSERYATTLPNRDSRFSEGLSFWHAEKAKEYAEERDLEFRTDDQKWLARDRLQHLWRKIAGMVPGIQGSLKDAQRAAAQQEPALEAGIVPDVYPDGSIQEDAEGVKNDLAADERTDDGRAPKGRRLGGRKATEKAIRTRTANDERRRREEDERNSHELRRDASQIDVATANAGARHPPSAAQSLMAKLAWGKGK